MKRLVNIIIILLTIVSLFIVSIYTSKVMELQLLLHKDCTLPAAVCPAKQIPTEYIIVFIIGVLIIAVSLFDLIMLKRFIETNKESSRKIANKIKNLTDDQKKIYYILKESGAMFQSELIEKSEMNKVKVTRILDKMEGFGLIERKRRGMSNMVVLKR